MSGPEIDDGQPALLSQRDDGSMDRSSSQTTTTTGSVGSDYETTGSNSYNSVSDSDEDHECDDDDTSSSSDVCDASGSVSGRLQAPSSNGSVFERLDALFSQRGMLGESAAVAIGKHNNARSQSARHSTKISSEVLSLLAAGPSAAKGNGPVRESQPRGAVGSSQSDSGEAELAEIGFLIHLKASDKVILVVSAAEEQSISAFNLRHHAALLDPTLRAVAMSGRLVATLHLTSQCIATSKEYLDWMQTLFGPQLFCGRQYALQKVKQDLSSVRNDVYRADLHASTDTTDQPSVSSGQASAFPFIQERDLNAGARDIGFQASVRATSRLNLVADINATNDISITYIHIRLIVS